MSPLPIYQVDAFASELFRGNPAAVVPLEAWREDHLLQQIARENNLSETAFFVPLPDDDEADFHLRWFTPAVEVDLCGHATLATAHVLGEQLGFDRWPIRFRSRSGVLRVEREGERLVLDFPSRPPRPREVDGVAEALGATPEAVYEGQYGLAVFPDETSVRALQPDFRRMRDTGLLALIVSAPADEDGVDFVSRFFAPAAGVDEDPVTGSAHCTLVPYWAERLGRNDLVARQISERGGELWCRHCPGDDRVRIGGRAVTYLRGSIEV